MKRTPKSDRASTFLYERKGARRQQIHRAAKYEGGFIVREIERGTPRRPNVAGMRLRSSNNSNGRMRRASSYRPFALCNGAFFGVRIEATSRKTALATPGDGSFRCTSTQAKTNAPVCGK